MASLLALVISAPCPARDKVGVALRDLNCRHWIVSAENAEAEVARRQLDCVILRSSPDDPASSIDCLRRLHAQYPRIPFVFIASISTEDLAIAALQSGAREYLRDPWTPSTLQHALEALFPGVAAAPSIDDGLRGGERLIGRSASVRELRARLGRVAPATSNVLVLGETGTGKELVAELLHLNGPRSSKPFVCINTAAIPDALLENELFGHERGAFTGASDAQGGKLAAAHGGTVFLDEIGDLPVSMQAKLLRALESKSVYRLGATRSMQLDIRLIAATNSDLERATSEGRFRKDLYYRLNVVRVELPPLRERVEDIPLLIRHYLREFNRAMGRSIGGLSERSMQALCAYHWPGNIRELRNVIEALVVNLAPETTGVVDVPPEVMRQLTFAVGAPTSER